MVILTTLALLLPGHTLDAQVVQTQVRGDTARFELEIFANYLNSYMDAYGTNYYLTAFHRNTDNNFAAFVAAGSIVRVNFPPMDATSFSSLMENDKAKLRRIVLSMPDCVERNELARVYLAGQLRDGETADFSFVENRGDIKSSLALAYHAYLCAEQLESTFASAGIERIDQSAGFGGYVAPEPSADFNYLSVHGGDYSGRYYADRMVEADRARLVSWYARFREERALATQYEIDRKVAEEEERRRLAETRVAAAQRTQEARERYNVHLAEVAQEQAQQSDEYRQMLEAEAAEQAFLAEQARRNSDLAAERDRLRREREAREQLEREQQLAERRAYLRERREVAIANGQEGEAFASTVYDLRFQRDQAARRAELRQESVDLRRRILEEQNR